MDYHHLHALHTLADDCPYDFGADSLPDSDGFLGIGGDLSAATLLHAYRCGAFPWYSPNEPICWWSPDVRCVIRPSDFRPSKSLQRTAKTQAWAISSNLSFLAVVEACSQPRQDSAESWIGDDIKAAYSQLNQLGAASSIEVWTGVPQHSELIGGLYGVHFGSIFCGESMFHRKSDASKIAFWALMQLSKQAGIELIDCQVVNNHLLSLGASKLAKADFLKALTTLVHRPSGNLQTTKGFGSHNLMP
ncbi:leucyl/phenylalanyl-tRNA--protein transferase [Moraxella cuniculi DSM 21768]|uniref:Leucyl/phenylalanyl-tRNA--protein transferase n=1 Tax=Moraxella cuniculi DSM 21768 TaxID=1122245 RepID=A0A1N7EEM8_9GAMM|nr:leucyl/phenylalanyl-tRNA--protein transferase [Moraxella cuniculi]OOS05289.1 leucyl/phenylalanyl-tRNA--protein transferase [Moraxella cuniculi]SIR86520.1 leucyl/phenylalanyl-tRNA--protein transferase [Moraxella cuniculi DSM 21768]